MKFISRIKNYGFVLRPGLPGNKFSGQPPQPGLHVRFKDNEVIVNDENVIKMMLDSSEYENHEFVTSDQEEADKILSTRIETEPRHNILELEHGAIAKNVNPKPAKSLTVDQMKFATQLAKEMAKEMFNEFQKRETQVKPESIKEPESIEEPDEYIQTEIQKKRGRPKLNK